MTKRQGSKHGRKSLNPIKPVSQQERVSWALTRWRAAKFKANMDKTDRVLELAAVARREEYERELLTLQRMETTCARSERKSSTSTASASA